MPHSSTTYALVTAVKNEERHLENTIRSVLQQDIAPVKWIIVNDHSTDSTGDIIQSYANQYPFIEGIESENRSERNFASKTKALRCAFQRLRFTEYSYIGNLDADITFESHFYSSLMEHFSNEPTLGCIGGVVWERIDGRWRYNHLNPEWCVGGATHFFRSELFSKIGSYPPLKYGGEDTVVEFLIRDMGYRVKAFTELPVYHHKPTGPEFGNGLQKSFRLGRQEYYWGTSLFFEMFKCVKRMNKKPFIIGASARLWGFLLPLLSFRRDGMVSPEIRKIIRRQQKSRMFSDLMKLFRCRRVGKKQYIAAVTRGDQ